MALSFINTVVLCFCRGKSPRSSKEIARVSSLERTASPLRSSHSDYELNKSGIPAAGSPKGTYESDDSQAVLDYYNILVPHLPANSVTPASEIGLRNQHSTRSTDALIKRHSANSHENGIDRTSLKDSPEDIRVGYSTLNAADSRKERGALDEVDGAAREPSIASRMPARFLSDVPTSKSLRISPVHSHGNSNYDSLAPVTDGRDTPSRMSPQPSYDHLQLRRDAKSHSPSPEPSTNSPSHVNKTYQYNRKVHLLQHGHQYEYIDVELPSSPHHEKQGHASPVKKEHPSSWVVPSPSGQDAQWSVHSVSSRRKKHLPLQDTHFEGNGFSAGPGNKSDVYSTLQRPNPQLPPLPKDTNVSEANYEPPKSPRKPPPLPRKGVHPQLSSNELVSSIDSYMAQQGLSSEPVYSELTNGRVYQSITDSRQPRPFPPLLSPNHEVKIKSIQVEIARESQEFSVDDVDLPSRRRTLKSSDSSRSSESPTPVPPVPPRPLNSDAVTSPPVQRLSEQSIKLPLPQKEINFHPPIPPKPRVLCPADNVMQKYVAVSFGDAPADSSSEYHEVVINPSTTAQLNVQQPHGSNGSIEDNRVEYSRVDFTMTYGLGKTIEQVEDRRRGFP